MITEKKKSQLNNFKKKFFMNVQIPYSLQLAVLNQRL